VGIKSLARKLLSCRSPYDAVLPYNLNWLDRDWDSIGSFLNQHPLNVVDIGARGASLEELDPLKRFINYFAFDADSVEAARLQNTNDHGLKSLRVFPYFVGGQNGAADFHLYKDPGTSSALLPNEAFLQFATSGFSVDRTVQVDARTLDSVMVSESVDDIDIIKLDTQGTEYQILAHAERSLSQAFLVEVEVEFFEMYKDQKLFPEVCQLMRNSGFELLYLNRVFMGRQAFKGESRGQLIFGDALFGRTDALASQLPAAKKAKYIVGLIQYGHMDFAHKLYAQDEAVRNLIPGVEHFFHFYSASAWGKLKRFTIMQLEKIIVLLLHARKTNQRGYDSDRSWPIR
jgi:FkbM family methyltransferase